jgi:hypothetical protein
MLATIRSRTLLSSRLLSKNIKIRIHKTIILPVVLHGCETWSLILREGQRLGMCENLWIPLADSGRGNKIINYTWN